jgi:hypothetical protein
MNAKKTDQKKAKSDTPDSATDLEKSKLGDEAVRDAVTTESGSVDRGTGSVLPGPPIPPEVQAEVREEKEPRSPRPSGRRGPAHNNDKEAHR